MTKREFLRGYIIMGRRIALKEKQLQRLHGEALDILKEDIHREIAELQEKRREILRVIDTAPTELERMIMEAQFINGENRRNIARMTGYSKSHQQRQYADAMKKMQFPEGVA